jgi:hypothetical protein
LLPGAVPHDEGRADVFDGPRRGEAAFRHYGAITHSLTKNAKFRDRPADDDRTNEPKEKYADPSASNHVASSGAVDRTNERTEKYGEPSASNHVVSNDTEYSTDYSRDRPRRREAAIGRAHGFVSKSGRLAAAARLRSLFLKLQPASVGIAKQISQIDDLVGHHRIRTGLQQGLKGVVDHLEVDLTQLAFFHGGYS